MNWKKKELKNLVNIIDDVVRSMVVKKKFIFCLLNLCKNVVFYKFRLHKWNPECRTDKSKNTVENLFPALKLAYLCENVKGFEYFKSPKKYLGIEDSIFELAKVILWEINFIWLHFTYFASLALQLLNYASLLHVHRSKNA